MFIVAIRIGDIMAIHKTLARHCPRCDADRDFDIVMRYVDYNGVIPCFRCPSCNVEVPVYSFNEFLATGKIVIGV